MDAREHGSKVGSAGVASEQHAAIDRRERLRRLALETIDLAKDPYFMRNHLGSYECKLCLTIHGNEGNYLAHTQGKRHQQNLAKRAAREAAENPNLPTLKGKTRPAPRKTVKIGRPGYRVTKQYDHVHRRRSLLFQIDFPEIETGATPRHRFMSAYEQKVEAWDKKYQYVMFAAEPYETIAFKVPNVEVDKTADRFFAHWEPDKKVYTVQLHFKAPGGGGGAGGGTGGYALPGEGQAGGTGGYALPSTNMGNDARYGETGGVILVSMGSFAPPPPPPGRLPVGVAPPPGAFAPPPPPPPPQ